MPVESLHNHCVADWPPLAWLVRMRRENAQVALFHGPGVEVTDAWFCEAAWAGDYGKGGFDRTDIVVGSGGRLRDGLVTLVASGTTTDRLHSLEHQGAVWVSNSLACLLAAHHATVEPSYPRYLQDFGTITRGIDQYKATLATSAGPVRLTYFDNLRWDGRSLSTLPKPHADRAFTTFHEYRQFLSGSLAAVAANAADARRSQTYALMGTLSAGYDSLTATVLGREAGCQEVICIDTDEPGGHDSGMPLADHLGLTAHQIGRDAWQALSLAETPFIAADANGEDVFMKGAEPIVRGRLLLTGYQGDKIWAKMGDPPGHTLARKDRSGLALTEYRLHAGFLHCPPAFWGARAAADINRISLSEKMAAWNVPGEYSRPICRRIAEEAGVPRQMFGQKKRAASVMFKRGDPPVSSASIADYLAWLRTHKCGWVERLPVSPRALLALVRACEVTAQRLGRRTRRVPALKHPERWLRTQGEYLRRHRFPWALQRTMEAYTTTAPFDLDGDVPAKDDGTV